MNRRWIRIDRAHRAFDCSESEFDAVLDQAGSVSGVTDIGDNDISSHKTSARDDSFDELQLAEAINAELAMLASLQRRDRILKGQRELSEQQAEQANQGILLAELHAATLSSRLSPKGELQEPSTNPQTS